MKAAEILTNLQKFLILLDPSINSNKMLSYVARQLVEMFDVDHSGILLFEENDVEGVVVAEYPTEGAVMLKVPLTDYPLVDELKREQKPIAVFDAQQDPIMGNARLGMQILGIQSILIIPLTVRGRIIGSLSLDVIGRQHAFTETEIDLCAIIGNQIGVAVDYAKALEQAEDNHKQAQTLRQINRVLGSSLDLDEILSLILEQLSKVMPVDGSSIYLLIGKSVEMKAQRGKYNPFQKGVQIPLGLLWGAPKIIETKKPILIKNTLIHPKWNVFEGSLVKSWLGVPLIVRGEVVGVLNMDGYWPDQFDETQVQLAQSFANQAALAIHNARLYGQATRRANLLTTVQEIGLSITASLDLQDVLEAIVSSVLLLVNANHASIYLYDAKSDVFTLMAIPDSTNHLTLQIARPRKDGLTARVARSGHYLAIPNILEHPFYQSHQKFEGFAAIIGVPLKKQDTVLGVLNVFYEKPHRFNQDEIDLLHLLSIQAAVALENARLYQFEVKQVEQELAIARQIQQGFFPTEIPSISGWEIAAICLPARETGGDFYEFIKRSDKALGLIIGDVSGKSIQGAMLMAASQSLIRAKGSDHYSPAKVLKESNYLLCDDVPQGSFVALSYAVLTPDCRTVYFSSAGQLAPFLVPAQDQAIQLIETDGNRLPLGVIRELSYEDVALTLAPGDILVFHTDGLVECQNKRGDMLGFEQITSLLAKLRGLSPQDILQTLLKTVKAFSEGAETHDDITLVIVQCKSNGEIER